MFCHPRHLGVAEDRDAVWLDHQGGVSGFGDTFGGLMRQAVNQVQVQRRHAHRTQAAGAAGGGFKRLFAPDGFLHDRIEILHPEAGATDTHGADGVERAIGKLARIDLDGDFGVGFEGESAAQFVGNRHHAIRRQHCGRAAAPVHMRHRQALADGVRDQVDFLQQRLRIAAQGLVLPGNGGVTAAEQAQRGAERHVQVERQLGAAFQLRQPGAVRCVLRHRHEMRRGGVGGVARDAAIIFRQKIIKGHARQISYPRPVAH